MNVLTLESLRDPAGDAIKVDVAEGGDRQAEPRLVALAGQGVELTEAVLGRREGGDGVVAFRKCEEICK